MRKFLSIILGFFIGISSSLIMINNHKNYTAYSDLNIWNDLVASGNLLEWNDVFKLGGLGNNLYMLVYDKIVNEPEDEALKEIAKKYGLTTLEAKSARDGSYIPFYNNPNQKSGDPMTKEEASYLSAKLREDYAELKEIFELQSTSDAFIKPTEIFANNDLSDSGFDLVHDLTKIEEILFVDVIPNTVGQPFGDQLTSPYLPTEPDQTVSNYIASENPAAVLSPLEANGGIIEPGEFEIGIGGEDSEVKVKVSVRDEDICPSDNQLSDVIDDYKEEVAKNEEELGGNEIGNVGAGDNGGNRGGNGASDQNPNPTLIEIAPATADDWLTAWCPSLTPDENGNSMSGNTFGEAGFSSLGDTFDSLLNQSAGYFTGYREGGISAHAAICLTVELIMNEYVSYQPGQSCVLCEIKKINKNMDKVLSHSLVPNKATGNLMESAKCKEAYQALPDFNFIVIKSPIPTPSNDDIIFGKNIFEEWKKFVDRYKPLLLDELKVSNITEFELESMPEDTSQQEILNSLNEELAKQKGEALREIEDISEADNATNVKLYSKSIMGELTQMTLFFRNYKEIYDKIYGTCQEAKARPTCD